MTQGLPAAQDRPLLLQIAHLAEHASHLRSRREAERAHHVVPVHEPGQGGDQGVAVLPEEAREHRMEPPPPGRGVGRAGSLGITRGVEHEEGQVGPGVPDETSQAALGSA